MDYLKRIGSLTILAAVTIRATTKERWHGLLTVFFYSNDSLYFFYSKHFNKNKNFAMSLFIKK